MDPRIFSCCEVFTRIKIFLKKAKLSEKGQFNFEKMIADDSRDKNLEKRKLFWNFSSDPKLVEKEGLERILGKSCMRRICCLFVCWSKIVSLSPNNFEIEDLLKNGEIFWLL